MEGEILPRSLMEEVKKFMGEKEAIIILGPRRAGKTTLLKHLKAAYGGQYISFTDPVAAEAFSQNPVEFVKGSGESIIYLDEVQYLGKKAGRLIKYAYDEVEGEIKLIISGSGAFHIRSGLSASMVGRAFFTELFPLSFEEYLTWKCPKRELSAYKKGKIDLAKPAAREESPLLERCLRDFLIYGGYPEVVKAERELKLDYLKSIVRSSVEEDIINYFSIKEAHRVWRVLRQLAALTGNVLTISELGPYTTVSEYLSIFSYSYIVELIQSFHRNRVTELRRAHKAYFIDNGFRNALLDDFKVEGRADAGAVLEDYVFTELKKRGHRIKYWRTKSKAEVDFIIEKEEELIPIEVKTGRGRITRSLLSFIETYRPPYAIVISNERWERKFGDTQVVAVPPYFL